MTSNHLTLSLIFLFFSSFIIANINNVHFFNDEPIDRLVKKKEEASDKYVQCRNSGGGNACITTYLGELNTILNDIDAKTGAIGDYLSLKILDEILSLNTVIELSGKEDFEISFVKSQVFKARKSLSSTDNKDNKFTYQLLQAKPKDLDLLHLNTNNLNDSVEVVRIGLDAKIRLIERMIYEATTPNKSLMEIDRYFDKQASYNNGDFSYYAETAMLDYYRRYTLDGDKLTITAFQNENYGPTGTLRQNLRQKLIDDKILFQDTEIAEKGFALLNSNAGKSELLDFAKRNAPRGIAFKVLLKAIAPELDAKQFGEALAILSELEPRFCNDLVLFKEACENFKITQHAIQDMMVQGVKARGSLSGDIDGRISDWQLNVAFSQVGNYLTILPFRNNSSIEVFQKADESGERWNYFASAPFVFNDKNSYWFELNPAGKKLESDIIEKRVDLQFRGFGNAYNTDYFVYTSPTDKNAKLLFFASSADVGRHLPAPNGIELMSPWNVQSNVSFQEYTNSASFHGRRYGNVNTDLYVCKYDPTSANWLPPVHLGNIVNSRYCERSPFYDGSRLYFASEGHGTVGGFDIFSVEFNYLQKGPVVNSGVQNEAALNTSKDELSYVKQSYGEYIASNFGNASDGFKIYKLGKPRANSFEVRVSKETIHENGPPSIVTITYPFPVLNDIVLPILLLNAGQSNASHGEDYRLDGLQNNKLLIRKGQTEANFSIQGLIDDVFEGMEFIKISIDGKNEFVVNIVDVVSSPTPTPTPTPSPTPTPTPAPDSDKVPEIELFCESVNDNPGVPNHYIAKVTVIAKDAISKAPIVGAEITGTYVDVLDERPVPIQGDVTNSRGHATFDLPTGTSANFRLTKMINGEVRYFDVFRDTVCPVEIGPLGPSFLMKTIKMNVVPVNSSSGFKVPFFFEFNQSNISSEINNLKEVEGQFRYFASTFKDDSSETFFIVVAFADTTGKLEYNCNLSRARAQRVADKLVAWGLPAAKIKYYGLGETSYFDRDLVRLSDVQFGGFFPASLSGPSHILDTEQRKRLQLNRRAQVIYCRKNSPQSCVLEFFPLGTSPCFKME